MRFYWRRMPPAFCSLTSTIPRFFVGFDAQAVHQLVETAEQVNHSHQFDHPLVV